MARTDQLMNLCRQCYDIAQHSNRIQVIGEEPLEIIAVLAASPVAVFLPDEQLLDLPWPN